MVSFSMLWEEMQSNQEESPLQASNESSLSMQTIRAGFNMRGDFWQDFLRLCQSADGVSELLNVRPDQVSTWVGRINDLVERVRQEDENSNANKKNLMPTGDMFSK